MTWLVITAPGTTAPIEAADAGPLQVANDEADVALLAGAAARNGAERIAVVGADCDLATAAGSVHETGARPALALLPAGPSALHRMFGLDSTTAVARLRDGTRYPADLGQVTTNAGHRFFVAAASASRWPGRWTWRRPETVTITTDRRKHEMRGSLVVAANAQHLGDRNIAPRAALMDGMLDIHAFGGSLLQRRRAWAAARRGLHAGRPGVWRRRATASQVVVPEAWSVRADGVSAGLGPFTVALIPLAFDLWI